MNTTQTKTTCPWERAIRLSDTNSLCKHVCDTINLTEGVEVVGCVAEPAPDLNSNSFVKVFLKKNGADLLFDVAIQAASESEPILKAKAVLAQVILNDPLLLRGVSKFNCSEIVFHGRKIDITQFYDGYTIQTGAIINEIIRNISAESNSARICSIGLVPIQKNAAYLNCETTSGGSKRFYEEDNIRKWVTENGTAPFTRGTCQSDDIIIHGPAIVPMSNVPKMARSRAPEDSVKRARVIRKKHVSCLWDRSGSMYSMSTQSTQGLRNTFEEQRTLAQSSGNPTRFTLTTFDSIIERPVDMDDICMVDITHLDSWVSPRGQTKLYDAIVDEALRLSEQVAKGEDGVFIVMTDGHDTSSEANIEIVRKTLEKLQKEKDIECIFMAANIGNAQEVGASLGFNEDTSLTFDVRSADRAFRCASQSALRSVTGGSVAFTQMERQISHAPETGNRQAPTSLRSTTVT